MCIRDSTYTAGSYSLVSFSDVNETGSISGNALVTIKDAPTANFIGTDDTLTILYPSVSLSDVSEGNISSWEWSFGDNTNNEFVQNPYHTYDSLGIYQISLVVTDNVGCQDTIRKQIWVTDEYWMYIPCLLYTSPSPRDRTRSRMPSSA